MALVKCKECGGSVSNKAKNCPNCGAKAPKKTSVVTWLVLALMVFVGYVSTKSPTQSVASSAIETKTSPTAKQIEPVKPSWTTSTSKDEMTGKFSAFTHSPSSYPTKTMGFPYADVKSWMGVGCNSESEWVYFGFNNAPNLSNTETKDKYNLIKTRISWDDNVESISLTQNWGAKFIHFRNDAGVILKIDASKTVLLELQWHGEQSVYFKYDLNGSSKAIAKIRALCESNK